MSAIMDTIYKLLGFDILRCSEKDYQVKGLDVTLFNMGKGMYCDEKCDMTRQLALPEHAGEPCHDDGTPTFAVEISFINRAGHRMDGWFNPAVHKEAVNNYYCFIWTNHDKDVDDRSGKLTKVKSLELCIISYDNIAKIISDDFSPEFCDDIVYKVLDGVEKSHKENDKYRLNVNSMVHVVYSGYLYEKPINFVIKKSALRRNALLSIGFEMSGEGSKEYPVRYINLGKSANQYDSLEELMNTEVFCN